MYTEQSELQAGRVKQFRQQLLDAGWSHANALGELCSPAGDGVGTLWVGTYYTGGEYEIAVWKRPDTGPAVDRVVYRAHNTDLPRLALALGLYLTLENISWPPLPGTRDS